MWHSVGSNDTHLIELNTRWCQWCRSMNLRKLCFLLTCQPWNWVLVNCLETQYFNASNRVESHTITMIKSRLLSNISRLHQAVCLAHMKFKQDISLCLLSSNHHQVFHYWEEISRLRFSSGMYNSYWPGRWSDSPPLDKYKYLQ